MGLILFLAFTLLPAVEIYLLISVGSIIGGWNTFLLIVLSGVLGAYFAKTQGHAIMRRSQESLARGEIPADTAIDGLLVFLGGVLLITPGFVTDIIGLSMVMPFTRPLIKLAMKKQFSRWVQAGRVAVFSTSSMHSHRRSPERDVSPTVIDVTPIESRETRPGDETKGDGRT